eukprot:1139324-Pelagomonas_calceolata.AAC.5
MGEGTRVVCSWCSPSCNLIEPIPPGKRAKINRRCHCVGYEMMAYKALQTLEAASKPVVK